MIGLTVVAYGTSAPELGVAIRAALTGQADITVGNVVGANILNILLILGVSSLLAPICLSQELVRRDVPLLAVVSLALFLLSVDGRLQRYEGALLILGLVAYTRHAIRRGRESGEEAGYPRRPDRSAGCRARRLAPAYRPRRIGPPPVGCGLGPGRKCRCLLRPGLRCEASW